MKDNTLQAELREIAQLHGVDPAFVDLVLSAIAAKLPKEKDENLYGISAGMTEPVPMDTDPEAEGYNICLAEVKTALGINNGI